MGLIKAALTERGSETPRPQDPQTKPALPRKTSKINMYKFYMEWKGHPIRDLGFFHDTARELRPSKPVVWLAGDSSLDNKYWVPSSGPAGEPLPVEVPEIYYSVLNHPRPKPDVGFWMNHLLGDRATCINTAVEETMLRERDKHLNEHDAFIRDNLSSEDTLIVSVGANDVALRPSPTTILNMLNLAWLTRRSAIEQGTASPLAYFGELFGDRIQQYITRIVAKTTPRAIIVCMIYFPLEAGKGQSSWADLNLKALGYNSYPLQLQVAIRKMYEIATQKIQIPMTTVIPCPLYEVLDGQHAEDYTARVEPSAEGGRKMARKFVDMLEKERILAV